ncbi:MAG TPA: class I SAM-dependent methyltransferase [Chthonomonadales bacterium]|nr:class I SAM-dependent methyltransferase [Chthonomonadales bacterium]
MMARDNSWMTFFDAHAPRYLENVFTYATQAEACFLVEELALAPGARILDLGCGVGRHAVELALRGYRVTGVDLSEGMLAVARRRASEAGVEVEWVRADACRYRAAEPFDGAVCLCEGAFGLLSEGDDPARRDLRILRRLRYALRPGAVLVLNCLHAGAPYRRHTAEEVAQGIFDPTTLVERCEIEADTLDGKIRFTGRERSYTAPEIRLLMQLAGFRVRSVWGGPAGGWRRAPLALDDIEIMLVATRR